ncbi:MAG: MFS transporter [Clostridia bacterium]|nr:MFS transporter [Clostridia bacterium]
MKLNYKRTILVGFAFFLISAFWQAYDAIVPLALTNHFGMPQTISGIIMSVDNILAVFMLPIFGALSDKVMTKFGRRTPFIFIGTIAAVLSFVLLTVVNGIQINALVEEGIIDAYNAASELFNSTSSALKDSLEAGIINETTYNAGIKEAEAVFETAKATLKEDALELTLNNIWPLIGFIGVLLIVLVSMATFRSPAVALMPDVTIKPLRSKGNAIINLMGTAGGIIVLALSSIFGISKNPYMSYTGYVIATCVVMLVGLGVFVATVKEKKWADEMDATSKELGLDEVVEETGDEPKRALDRAEFKSLMLILASVALWYIGYNSITSKYSVYSANVLGVDYGLTLIVAQAAAIVSYIPVGIVASKFGRRKTILAGITMLATAFFIGNFIGAGAKTLVMYPIFILAGIGWATINVNSFPMVVELAKGGEVGKYTGYYYTASMAAQIVAPILSGALYDLFGMRAMFFSFGTVFVVASFVTMFFVKHGDAKPEAQGALESLGGADD